MTMPTSGSLGNRVAGKVFAGLPPRYDRLVWLLSFGHFYRDGVHVQVDRSSLPVTRKDAWRAMARDS